MRDAEIVGGVKGLRDIPAWGDIEGWLEELLKNPNDYTQCLDTVVNEILILARLVLIDGDAKLPKNPCAIPDLPNYSPRESLAYASAQQEMVAAGWRKVREEK